MPLSRSGTDSPHGDTPVGPCAPANDIPRSGWDLLDDQRGVRLAHDASHEPWDGILIRLEDELASLPAGQHHGPELLVGVVGDDGRADVVPVSADRYATAGDAGGGFLHVEEPVHGPRRVED